MSNPQYSEVPPGRLVTVAVLMVAAMTIMANATIAPSLPGLKAHFAGVAGIDTLAGLLLSLPSLSIVLSAGVFGWLADRYDRQKLLAAAGAFYAIGGTSGLWAETLPQMLVGRVVLGVGVAGTMTLGMAWAADLWQGRARERFLGLQGAAMSGGGIVVMLLGGALATLHWRGAFAVYALVLPVVIVALVALAPYARKRAAMRVADTGAARAAQAGAAFPWRTFAVAGPLGFFFMVTFYVMPTRLPFLMQDLGADNSMVIGMVMALMTLASIPGALAYGRIRRLLSAIAVFAMSFALMGLGMLMIGMATGLPLLIAGTVVLGAGMGPAMPNYTTYLMAKVPAPLRGRASGLLTTAFFAGQFASPLVSAPLVGQFGLPGTFATLALAMLALAAVLGAVAMRGQRGALIGESGP
jgi:MFS family permease